MKLTRNSYAKTIDIFVDQSIDNYLEFQNSSHHIVINGVILEDYNIFRDRYYDTIMQYTENITLSVDDMKKYKYRPKRLSTDRYHTIDYWYILLMINKMSSALEFTKRNINVLTYNGVEFLKMLAKKEESEIKENRKQIRTQLA